MQEIRTALTYDDVLLVPQRSELRSRQNTDVSTYLTKNIKLNIVTKMKNLFLNFKIKEIFYHNF